jgi:D-alanyl-D-alanine carboxypeptidase
VDLFPVYSIAKTFSAAAAVAMRIPLRQSLGELVDVPHDFRSLRLLDVLRHRAGLPDYGRWPEYRQAIRESEPWEFVELMDRARAAGMSAVGEFSYSNIGYAIVRPILEQLSGASYFDALASRVFQPLGMMDVAPFASPSDWSRCVSSSRDVSWYDPGWVLTGSFAATASGIAEAYRALLAGALGDPAVLLQQLPVDVPDAVLVQPGYALGLMTGGDPIRYAGHGGAGPGYTAFVLSSVDGRRAHAEFVTDEVDQDSLIRRCLAVLDSDSGN